MEKYYSNEQILTSSNSKDRNRFSSEILKQKRFLNADVARWRQILQIIKTTVKLKLTALG